MKKLSFNLKSFIFTTVLFTIVCILLNSCAVSEYQTPCAAYAEQTNANPEVSVTAIGEDSLCVAFTFYYEE